MGEIVVHGQKFTIKGDTPTPTEQVAIDSFLDFRENTSGLTGNKEFDEQGVLTLSPEEVLSEANKGKYNKDTESFLGSPSFKRLVTEVGLSIAGGIAGVALAPVTGGGSLVASAGLAARVASLSRPLLNISANTVRKIGAGTAGAAVGGGTGAALAQTFDPRDDIVKEVTRGALQGGLGELAGFGLAGALGKIYTKIARGKVNQQFGASRAVNILNREKEFFKQLLKIKKGEPLEFGKLQGVLTDEQIKLLNQPEEAQKLIKKIETEEGTDFLTKKVEKAAITPGLAVESQSIDLIEGIAKSSFFGGPLIRAQGYATNTLAQGMEAFGESIIKASKEGIDPEGYMIGKLLNDSVLRSKKTYEATKTGMWRDFNREAEKALRLPDGSFDPRYLVNIASKEKSLIFNPQIGKAEPTTSLKTFARDELGKLKDPALKGLGENVNIEQTLAKVLQLDDNLPYPVLNNAYTAIVQRLNPADPAQARVRAEIIKRMTHLQEKAKLPLAINGTRSAIVQFSKMGDEVFRDTTFKKIMNSEVGQEKLYKQIVVANNRSVTENFLKLIDKEVPVPGGGTMKLFENADDIKHGLRGQFFRNFLKESKDIKGQYEVLKPAKATKFLENYKSFIDDSGLITKEQAKNLRDYALALRFSEGTLTRPGVSGKAGTVFIQLKQAGALTQLGTVAAGGSGFIDPGTAVAFFMAPMAVSRMFASPKATKILIEGLKAQPRNFDQYSRLVSQMTSGLAGQGFIGPEQAKMAMDQVEGNREVWEAYFKGETLPEINVDPIQPETAPALTFNFEPREGAVEQARPSIAELPTLQASPTTFNPQSRAALASGDLFAAIAARPQLRKGGIVNAKKTNT